MSVALHHRQSGPEGAPVLLLGSSLGTTGSMWEPQHRALDRTLRCISFDHRGHGGSPAPAGPYTIAALGEDVIALMDRLGIERAAYAGISLGGMLGQWLAAHHPQRVERLVLIATSAHLGAREAWLERAVTVRTAGTTEVIADAVLSRWFTPGWAAEQRALIARLREDFCRSDPEGYAGCCEAIAELDLRAELARISVPTLVIGGAQDPAIPPHNQRVIAEAVRGARLELIEDAAHIPTLQHPAAVNALIADHLGVGL